MIAILLAGCGHGNSRQVVVIGVDGMDPGFVERHWNQLPNLRKLHFSRLVTTSPPQSPVAWSTFITGLDPADHGIFDFVRRDPLTRELSLSTDRILEPRFTVSLGEYRLPLSGERIEALRKGKAFWQTLSEHGVPVTIVRIPVNYPALHFGKELSGMETPDLRGTQSTFSFYTDGSAETSRAVPGGLIRKVAVSTGHAELPLEGPPNPFRKDRAYAQTTLSVDVDPEQAVARIAVGDELAVIQQGEWSDWIPVDFALVPHIVQVRGMIRVFAKQLHPGFELYVSPVNIDPLKPALPISSPSSFARDMGRYYTVGIAEDTAALRQGVFDLSQFLTQSRLVLRDERRLLDESLTQFRGGFLFFYFSAVDQNSHILWGKHDAELLPFYRSVDAAIGEVVRRKPQAAVIVMSDHGFSTFDRAVNLNTWLVREGWPPDRAYAVGLNSLYVPGVDRNLVRDRLLGLTDLQTGVHPVKTLMEMRASGAPDFIVGYAPGYRASWQTGLGESADSVFEDNEDAWIADHCINAADVPGVLFSNRDLGLRDPSLKNLSGAIKALFGIRE
ncbi:MAG: alkaline phosphatase family protein [Terriglobia bacterium]